MNAHSRLDPSADFAALASQRVLAEGRLAVRVAAGRTRIERCYQDGAAKIRMPDTAGDPLEAVLINTAGGLTGGDRLTWRVDVGAGASASVTTQACEKVYRAAEGHAELSATIAVAPGGRIAWLPQESILFDRSALRRRLDLDLAADAGALVVESVVFGRRAMGESVATASFSDRWRVRREGRLVHAEDFRIGPDVAAQLARRAVADGGGAMATLLLIGPDCALRLDEARAIIGDAGGASAWPVGTSGKLLARLVAGDSYRLRERLIPLIRLLNGEAGLPKVWSL